MQKEIKEIEEELVEIRNKSFGDNLKELFTVYRKIILVGVMLQVWQQVGGINTAMYYGPEMMKQAGFGDENNEKTVIN